MEEGILIFDGALGTMIEELELGSGEIPELLNFTNPERLKKIYQMYAEAGSRAICTNTFAANRFNLKDETYSVPEVVKQAVKVARESVASYECLVIMDVGACGEEMEPFGTLTFNEAYECYKEQVVAAEEAGADAVIFETFQDLRELKAAVLSAKENTNLPIICSVTFEENGTLSTGADPLTVIACLQDLGIDAIGINCTLNAMQMAPIVEIFLKYCDLPILIEPNSEAEEGMKDKAIQEYVIQCITFVEQGVQMIGGCCGTTPEYIKAFTEKLGGVQKKKRDVEEVCMVASQTKALLFEAKKVLIGRKEEKVNILDIDAEDVLRTAIQIPFLVRSQSLEDLEQGVREYGGKPFLYLENGNFGMTDQIFEIAKKYGANVICSLKENESVPQTCKERIKILKKVMALSEKWGIQKRRIMIDCLFDNMNQNGVAETINTIQEVKEYGFLTTLDISSLDFDPSLTKLFFTVLLQAGLDAPIVDAGQAEYPESIQLYQDMIDGKIRLKRTFHKPLSEYFEGLDFCGHCSNAIEKTRESYVSDLSEMIIKGLPDKSQLVTEVLLEQGRDPGEIIGQIVEPALKEVAKQYENNKIDLIHYIKSVETAKYAVEAVKK